MPGLYSQIDCKYAISAEYVNYETKNHKISAFFDFDIQLKDAYLKSRLDHVRKMI